MLGWSDQGRSKGTYRRKKWIYVSEGKTWKSHLEDTDTDGRLLLKLILKESDGILWTVEKLRNYLLLRKESASSSEWVSEQGSKWVSDLVSLVGG